MTGSGEARHGFSSELDQLRLQVELMGIRVDENLERTRQVLATGDERLAAAALAADDVIDDMHVSLLERCYALLMREAPVAADLRLVVSVIRVLGELERIGDLALRVVKLAPEWNLLHANPVTFDLLSTLADQVVDRYRLALAAWSSQDLRLAVEVAAPPLDTEATGERLTRELMALEGPDAVRLALRTLVAGRALDRIADHATIIGARVRYLLTGEPAHLASEVR